jgi:3-methyladenine DNA glycosylase AlkC
MSFQLKNIYNPTFLSEVATAFKTANPAFDTPAFMAAVFDATWPSLELKQRIRHISNALRQHLPQPYPEALATVVTVARQLIAEGDKMSFEWGILPDFVEAFGTDDPDQSLPALEVITRLASAEFAVRPFLLRYPDRMFAQMIIWADHESPMVRRLASEGFRPRLPWGMGVPVLKRDPTPIITVLEKLKNDPAETVRRSVANNLNDISKEHPALTLRLAKNWYGKTADTDWVVRHAMRGLLKKGHADAMNLFGFETTATEHISVENLTCTPRVAIGERLYFSFDVVNSGTSEQTLRLDYAIDYLSSTGKTSRKVFIISNIKVDSDQQIHFAKNQRFQDFTTRKHYPGAHRLEILVNGIPRAELTFEVVAAV